MQKILAINGSYRENGFTDQTVAALAQALVNKDAAVEVVVLRDYPIKFCLNCRACTQSPGEQPGECVLDDAMAELVEKIEQADAYILAAPTNFFSVTAVFKRFMERLTVYGYWPWEQPAPKYRKDGATPKKAILVSSCAAPGLMGRLLYASRKQLKMTARTIGAKPVGTLFTGLIASQAGSPLPASTVRGIKKMAAKLTA